MTASRKQFVAALGLFVVWVCMLAALAFTSARSPREAGSAPGSPVVRPTRAELP